MEFSVAKMKEIIKRNSGKQVSKDAAEELGQTLEMFAGDVAEEALAVAKDNGRKTVRDEDVQEALK